MATENLREHENKPADAPTERTLMYQCPHCDSNVEAEPRPDDEMVSCPVCKKPFRPEAPTARPKASERLIITDENGQLTEVDPEKEVAPTAEDAEQAENEVIRFRPAMFQAYPLRTILYVLIGCAGGVALGAGLYTGYWGVWLAGAIGIGFALYKLIGWYTRIRYTDVNVTNRRLIITQGLFKTSTVEVPHSNITDVFVSQDTFNQLTGVGDILIRTNGEDNRTVILMSVVHPEEVAEKIRAQKRVRD